MRTPAICLSLLLIAIFGFGAILYYQSSGIADYREAEPLHPLAQEFADSLKAEIERRNPSDFQWQDISIVMADQKFERLRKYAFAPATDEQTLIVLRINRSFDFPIMMNGDVGFTKRE